MDGTILVADDDRTIRTVLTQALTRAGCKVHATSSLMTLMRWVEEGKGDLVISDVVMPDGNGLEMLPRIAEERPGLPVIVISAQNTIMTAIQATEAEAYDYLPKPFDLPDLMKRAARALEQKRDARRRPARRAEQGDDLPLVGRTPRMQALYRLVARVMNTDLPVLITGESGTGKSLIARAIHDFSDRRTLPFVTATGGDLAGFDGPSDLLARARGGSILFDEVGDLEPEAQTRVVRMLDGLDGSGPRIMATTQRDLTPRLDAARERLPLRSLLPSCGRAARRAGPARAGRRHPAARRAFPRPGGARRRHAAALLDRGDGAGPRASLARQRPPARERDAPPRRHLAGRGDHPVRGGGGAGHHDGRTRGRPRPPTGCRRRSSGTCAAISTCRAGSLPPAGLYQRVLREVEAPLIEIALDATAAIRRAAPICSASTAIRCARRSPTSISS